MNKAPPSPLRVFVISAFALSCFGLLLFLWLAFGGPVPLKPQGYEVRIAFSDASTLAEQADVRTAGVSIGKVVGKELDPEGNRTLATLRIDRRFAPLRSDARAILRQKTLLGETYVELTPGSRSAPFVKEDGRLPNARVADSVEFDELLRIFDPKTRRAFRDWQQTLAEAGRGRGRDVNDALGNLAVFAQNGEDVIDVLDRRRTTLRALLRNTRTTFAALTRNEGALQTLIRRNTDAFTQIGNQRKALAEAVKQLPEFVGESRSTLARLRTFSRQTTPLVRDLQPVLRDLEPTVASLRRLSPDLHSLFVDLDPLITAGRAGLPATARVLRGLDPTLKETGPFLQQLNPVLAFLELHQGFLSNFLSQGPSALAGKRSVLPGSKSNGHFLPQIIVAGTQTLPALVRTPDNRGNAYQAPFFAPDPTLMTLPSFDCQNSGRKAPDLTPGCREAGPIPFQGLSQQYPNVRQGLPGGTLPTGP